MSLSRAPRRRRSTSGRALLLTAVTAVGALTLTACGESEVGGASRGSGTNFVTSKDTGTSTVAKGKRTPAPKLDGKTVDGGTLDVADLKGKVVVLNVWGSWCAPCRAEAPHFAKVAKDLKPKGVEFVGINIRNTPQAAQAFDDRFGIPYPSLHDPDSKLLLRFPKGTLSLQTIPSTLVLDREGKIAARALIGLNEEQLRKMIDPVAAEK
ncbi:TlpA family protein disulfide reductase [Streptomyces bambusae]|uniref:TlpA family protein disulfide reductase n=1 Tax=Streptomyces bambusae TaxID=1550616 RepID=UPI001CFDB486|nr:TlpA disulfide reductase family protein [Streptomyces bambusae]MCB5169015.1 TlpA family protein disulfide reductase [Streptomyces bambusae]